MQHRITIENGNRLELQVLAAANPHELRRVQIVDDIETAAHERGTGG